jgi:multimeric flavodoxin WrbA
MSGQLKTFLDHLAYRWMAHRPYPKIFNKVGLVVSTAAGAGTKKVTKSLSDNLFYWGVPKIYCYGKSVAASSWETVKPEKKLKIEQEVKKISSQIVKQVGKVKPGLKPK